MSTDLSYSRDFARRIYSGSVKTDVVTCLRGHSWVQYWDYDGSTGQSSLLDDDDCWCPECGSCPVDCECGDCEERNNAKQDQV